MRKSDEAAISAGTLTALVFGITASLLCPLAGTVFGAYFAAAAAMSGGFGALGITAVGVGGALGGYVVGKLVKPLAIWAAVGLGVVAGGVTKASGVGYGFLSRSFAKAARRLRVAQPFKKLKNTFRFRKAKPSFDAAAGKNPAGPPSRSAPDAPKPAP